MEYQWDWSVVTSNSGAFVRGIQVTVILSILAMLLSSVCGLGVALLRLNGFGAVRVLVTVYVEFFRTTPLLIQLFWLYYGLPYVTGISLDPFIAGLLALTLNISAFNSEIFRAGIISVGREQERAALALGLSPIQAGYRVILPQAVRRVIPPLGSQWVAMFQNTALVSFISVGDLMFHSLVIRANTYRSLEVLTATALFYLLLGYPQAKIVDYLKRRSMTSEV
jgi:His/Glu/Gln/Arg/opine family amino acid ABC transporter permease subunit